MAYECVIPGPNGGNQIHKYSNTEVHDMETEVKFSRRKREEMIEELAQRQLDEMDDYKALLQLAKERLESIYDSLPDDSLEIQYKIALGIEAY